jgi:hypothetical protein
MSGEGMQTYGGGEWAEEDVSDTLRSANKELLAMLHKGMDVYDQHEHKIGKIEEISAPMPTTDEFYVTVSTGFLGLGHDLYIPSNYLTVSNVESPDIGDLDRDEGVATGRAQVGVGVDKEALYTMGWDKPPAWANQATLEGERPESSEAPPGEVGER